MGWEGVRVEVVEIQGATTQDAGEGAGMQGAVWVSLQTGFHVLCPLESISRRRPG